MLKAAADRADTLVTMGSPRSKPSTTARVALAGIGAFVLMLAASTPGVAIASRSGASPKTTQAARAAKTCGGEALPSKPGGGAWTCTFDDEFSAATGDPKALNTAWWTPQLTATSAFATGPVGAEACYVNSTNNISVSGGALHLTARREAAPFSCAGLFTTQYTAGMVTTYTGFNQTYGRFEVRALLPQTTASRPPGDALAVAQQRHRSTARWPDSGEVDFSEFYSQYASLDVPYIHYLYSPSTVNAGDQHEHRHGDQLPDLARRVQRLRRRLGARKLHDHDQRRDLPRRQLPRHRPDRARRRSTSPSSSPSRRRSASARTPSTRPPRRCLRRPRSTTSESGSRGSPQPERDVALGIGSSGVNLPMSNSKWTVAGPLVVA